MTPEDLERAHRALAPSLFNRVWELMDKKNRTEDETDEMLHAAHASRHHWMTIGEPVNLVRGDWQVSRAYCSGSCTCHAGRQKRSPHVAR